MGTLVDKQDEISDLINRAHKLVSELGGTIFQAALEYNFPPDDDILKAMSGIIQDLCNAKSKLGTVVIPGYAEVVARDEALTTAQTNPTDAAEDQTNAGAPVEVFKHLEPKRGN